MARIWVSVLHTQKKIFNVGRLSMVALSVNQACAVFVEVIGFSVVVSRVGSYLIMTVSGRCRGNALRCLCRAHSRYKIQ